MKNSRILAEKIKILIKNKKQRQKFGKYSRRKAEKEFDRSKILNRIIRELYGE